MRSPVGELAQGQRPPALRTPSDWASASAAQGKMNRSLQIVIMEYEILIDLFTATAFQNSLSRPNPQSSSTVRSGMAEIDPSYRVQIHTEISLLYDGGHLRPYFLLTANDC